MKILSILFFLTLTLCAYSAISKSDKAVQDSEIIRTDSMGLTIFNPKNLADRIKGMKNKVKQTREEKIAIAKMQQSQAIN